MRQTNHTAFMAGLNACTKVMSYRWQGSIIVLVVIDAPPCALVCTLPVVAPSAQAIRVSGGRVDSFLDAGEVKLVLNRGEGRCAALSPSLACRW